MLPNQRLEKLWFFRGKAAVHTKFQAMYAWNNLNHSLREEQEDEDGRWKAAERSLEGESNYTKPTPQFKLFHSENEAVKLQEESKHKFQRGRVLFHDSEESHRGRVKAHSRVNFWEAIYYYETKQKRHIHLMLPPLKRVTALRAWRFPQLLIDCCWFRFRLTSNSFRDWALIRPFLIVISSKAQTEKSNTSNSNELAGHFDAGLKSSSLARYQPYVVLLLMGRCPVQLNNPVAVSNSW